MSKFYRTIIQVEILSESPYNSTELNKIHHDITLGPCSGHIEVIESSEITPEQMAKFLLKQGSDPEFFNLTEDGKEINGP